MCAVNYMLFIKVSPDGNCIIPFRMIPLKLGKLSYTFYRVHKREILYYRLYVLISGSGAFSTDVYIDINFEA